MSCCRRWWRETPVQVQASWWTSEEICFIILRPHLCVFIRSYKKVRDLSPGEVQTLQGKKKTDSHFLFTAAEVKKMSPRILFSYTNKRIHLVFTRKFHVSCEAAKVSLNIRSLWDWMRTWLHVSPHLDLVFLHFQSVKPWRSLIMKGLSLFQRTASQLIWLRYVCQNGGTVSKAYIFYECSLIWLNNLTISPLEMSSSSQLMWLSFCLNKITQMYYAIFVMLWVFSFSSSGVCPIFLSVSHLLLKEKTEVPSFSGKSDKHMDKA